MPTKIVLSISVCFAVSLTALAQEPNRPKGQGYAFFAPGAGNPYRKTLHFGVGGEGFIYKGLGIGVEIGPVGPWSTRYGGWYAVGLGSANFSYHFFPRTVDRKVEPFVTAGYSMFFRHGTFSGYNVGVGLNGWLNKNVALRFEARSHLSNYYDVTEFRIGVTFR